jgi:hypothetical protein
MSHILGVRKMHMIKAPSYGWPHSQANLDVKKRVRKIDEKKDLCWLTK